MGVEKNLVRRRDAQRLRAEGKTLDHIGRVLGVSRERARQLLRDPAVPARQGTVDELPARARNILRKRFPRIETPADAVPVWPQLVAAAPTDGAFSPRGARLRGFGTQSLRDVRAWVQRHGLEA